MGVAEAALLARLVLAGVFALAAAAKLADRARSEEAVANFGIPERLVPTVAFLLPLAEIWAAVMLPGWRWWCCRLVPTSRRVRRPGGSPISRAVSRPVWCWAWSCSA